MCYDAGFGRSLSRYTNFRPDQTSSMAQIFTSTRPAAKPMSRTIFSLTSVCTPEVFFGQEIQIIPFAFIFPAYCAKAVCNAARLLTKKRMKSRSLHLETALTCTLDGSSSCCKNFSGAFTNATVNSDLMPSFLIKGVPEYPAKALRFHPCLPPMQQFPPKQTKAAPYHNVRQRHG